MIGAKLAKLKVGDVVSQMSGAQISPPSAQQVADMLNINRGTVVNAKKVLSNGTFEEIAAIENGKAAVSTLAIKIKKREKEDAAAIPPTAKNDDRRIPDSGWLRILDSIQGCLEAVEAVMAEDEGNTPGAT